MNSTLDIAIGALGAGLIGLLFFFVRSYFTHREKTSDETRHKTDSAVIQIAKLEAKLEEQTKMLLDVRDDTKFIKRQLARVFEYIDAPQRSTDNINQM